FDVFVEQISGMWATQPNWSDAQVAAITVPTAIVVGDHDEAILWPHTEHMAATIPNATLVVLPEVSHFAMLQAPGEYNAAIRAFID
ncbi:MAG TPA: alpha/beta hydrolase, partial [Alteraurantiacibacter sp.]